MPRKWVRFLQFKLSFEFKFDYTHKYLMDKDFVYGFKKSS